MTDRNAVLALLAAALMLAVPEAALADAADAKSFFVSGQLGASYFFDSGVPEDAPSGGLQLCFAPRVLYFPVKSIGVGGEAGLDMYLNSTKTTSLAIGPRGAYYIKMKASRYPRGCLATPWFGSGASWMPFVGVSLLYLTERADYGAGVSTASGYRGRLGVGAAPMIGDRGTVFVELGFQTQSLKAEGSTARTSNMIYLEAGLGAFLHR